MNDEFGSKKTIYQKGLILKKSSLVDGFFCSLSHFVIRVETI